MQSRCMDEYVDNSERLLAGMWEFPNCAGEGGQGWALTMCAILSIGVSSFCVREYWDSTLPKPIWRASTARFILLIVQMLNGGITTNEPGQKVHSNY